MNAIITLLADYMVFIVGGLTILLIVVFFVLFSLIRKVNKLKKRYDFFMGANRRPDYSLETKLNEYVNTVRAVQTKYRELVTIVKDIDTNLSSCIQKVGVVRYNPYDEERGNLCYAVALLDSNDNGVVFNGIHSKTGSFAYAKPLELGVSTYVLSKEEEKAVELAKKNAYHKMDRKIKVKRKVYHITYRGKMKTKVPVTINGMENFREDLEKSKILMKVGTLDKIDDEKPIPNMESIEMPLKNEIPSPTSDGNTIEKELISSVPLISQEEKLSENQDKNVELLEKLTSAIVQQELLVQQEREIKKQIETVKSGFILEEEQEKSIEEKKISDVSETIMETSGIQMQQLQIAQPPNTSIDISGLNLEPYDTGIDSSINKELEKNNKNDKPQDEQFQKVIKKNLLSILKNKKNDK